MTEDHEVTITEVPSQGPFEYHPHVVFCSCGDLLRPLTGWYITGPGAELWKRKHLAKAAGEDWADSTAYAELRLRSFMEKREDAERAAAERRSKLPASQQWGRSHDD